LKKGKTRGKKRCEHFEKSVDFEDVSMDMGNILNSSGIVSL